jgi:hypothetical protein
LNEQLTPHFSLSEFQCQCCGQVLRQPALELAVRLEPVRTIFGTITIISGYRCPNHNQQSGGKPNSAHLRGLAADIACGTDARRFTLLSALLANGFKRLGIGKAIIHADIDTITGPVIWTYYP